jgi:branched-chain amino acid transport system substrate-binding protein
MNTRVLPKIIFSFSNISFCLWLAGIFFVVLSHPLFAEPFNDKLNLTESYQQAESFFHAGDFEKARPHYQKYIDDHPQGIKVSQVLFRLGQMDQAKRSYSTALRYYQVLLEKFSKRSDRVPFLMGECHYELGQYYEAQGFFRQVAGRHPDIKLRMEALFYLGKIDEKKFDFSKAIEKLARVYIQNDNREIKNFARASVEKIIDESLSRETIASLIKKYPSGFPAGILYLKLISIYRNQSDITNFQDHAAVFVAKFPAHSERPMILRQLKSLETNPLGKVRVGVVLPLTGKRAIVGQQVLQGVQLALNQLGGSAKNTVELVVKDSAAGTPLTDIIAELAGDPYMAGIIGPVLSGEVKAIVPIVDKYQIPVFTPTASSDGLPDLSAFIFRNALTRGIQARFLAQYSINHLNLRRFAILYPVETYGIEFSKLFKNEVEALGGEVVVTVSYDRKQTDFRTQILELGGLPDKQLERIAKDNLLNGGVTDAVDGKLSRPVIDMGHWNNEEIENFKTSLELNYDAIFIPGFYDKVGLIVPQLVFYNIDDVVLLGANGWNSPKLVKNAGKYIKEGFYVDGFFPDSNRLGVQKFVEAFKATFGKDPALHSAQAYDSANMMIQSILEGANNRSLVKERLTGIKNYPGISGTTTLLPSGDSEKKLFTLRIKNRKVQQME